MRARIARRLTRELHLSRERHKRGALGRFVREAVREHPYVYGGDPSRVAIAADAVVNDAFLNCASGTITIERHAFFGSGVSLLTGTHDVRELGAARQSAVPRDGRDIVIEEGAWIASNAIVLGPCRVGRHAVVAAGAVVTGDVPAFAVVSGVPARVTGQVPR